MASSGMPSVDSGCGNGCQFAEKEKEKGSRNKRKYGADPPLPFTECNGNANANKGFVDRNGWKMEYHSIECSDGNGNSSATLNHNHHHYEQQHHSCYTENGFCNFSKAQQEHLNNYSREGGYRFEEFSAGERLQEEREMEERLQEEYHSIECSDGNGNSSATLNHNHHHYEQQHHSCYTENGFCNFSKAQQEHLNNYSREGGYRFEEFSAGERLQEEREMEERLQEEREMEERLQEVDWLEHSVSQLEDLLLNNLVSIYRSTKKKMVGAGYTEDTALKAVLKHGKCYDSLDTISNIVDNALGHLSNAHDVSEKELYFEDLQQLEKCKLEEMVCLLRKVRPSLSTGEAMWYLLLRDMNLAHDFAKDEDAPINYNKDSMPTNSPAASTVQSNPDTSLSSTPPTISTNVTTFNNVSCSQLVPRNPQVANSSMPFVVGVPTYPNQGFSMSANVLQTSCKHDNISASSISENLQSGLAHPFCRMGDSKFSCNLQGGEFSSSDHFQCSSSFTATLGTESKPVHNVSEMTTEDCALSMAQPFQKAEKNIYETSKTKDDLDSNPAFLKGTSGTLIAPSSLADKTDHIETSEVCLYPIEKGSCLEGIENSDASCRTMSGSCIECSSGNEVQQNGQHISGSVQTDLLIGKSNQSVEPELSMRGCRVDPETVDDRSGFVVSDAELSLSLASSRDQGAVVNHSMSVAEEAVDSNYDTVPLDQIFGGNGAQENRVRELETQIQKWTEWAQQKVMQAAHRLSKEKAELEALRQEKKEAINLKKEKQSLEENTMKKLSEMENALRKASGQVERANAAVRKLEEENAQLRHEMEVAKRKAVESAAACQEVSEREKKTLKRFQSWDRQKSILQEELAREKRKLVHLQQQLAQAKQRQKQIEVRCRQEEKAKEEAIMRVAAEREAKEQIEATAKRKEEALHLKAETDSQRYRDDVQCLEREIAQLRLTTDSSKLAAMQWGSDCSFASSLSDTNNVQVLKQTHARLLSEIAELQDLSRSNVQRDRECVMCLSEERSVVFLPCAHQVVCTKCNDLHEKQGMNDCPSCRTPIKQRLCVYSANS